MKQLKSKNKIKDSGFTLLETLFSISLLGFMFFALVITFMGVGKAHYNTMRAVEVEAEGEVLYIVIQKYLKNAINIDWTSGAINNIGTGRGLIRKYQSGLSPSIVQEPIVIAAFLRDVGVNASDIRASVFFLKEPTYETPGTLLVSTSSSGSGTVNLNSNASQFKLENVVEVVVEPSGFVIPDGEPVREVKITTVQRLYKSDDKGTRRWCPVSIMNTDSNCKTTAIFRDITEYHYITLDKNVIDTGILVDTLGNTRKETIGGNLYFFNAVKAK